MALKRKRANDPVSSVSHSSTRVGIFESELFARVVLGLVCVALIFLYNSDDTHVLGKDASGNISVVIQLLKRHTMEFSPQLNHKLFEWEFNYSFDPSKPNYTLSDIHEWSPEVEYYYNEDRLRIVSHEYFITPTARKGVYVSTFGIGSGLTALPFYAAVHYGYADVSLHENKAFMWSLGRFVASICVCIATLCIYFTSLDYTTPFFSGIVSISFALGTCAWSISSQNLWQHGPNEMYLTIGFYFWSKWYLNRESPKRNPSLAALFFSFAVFCRPTSAIYPATIFLFASWKRLKGTAEYASVGAVFASIFLGYNHYYFGDPFSFGQRLAGEVVAKYKTGSTSLWQTPIYEGMLGLLFSPSRGLFVYSPFLLFSLLGACEIIRNPQYHFFIPIMISMAPLLVAAFTWFDWWGGWCYGYRPIVDMSPFLVMFLIPLLPRIWSSSRVRYAFLSLLAFSVYVQYIGAFSYDGMGWNGLYENTVYERKGGVQPVKVFTAYDKNPGYYPEWLYRIEERQLDVDKPEHRHRLWSLSDNQIWFYHTTWDNARDVRRHLFQQFLERQQETF